MSISDWSSDVCFSDLHGVDSTTVEAIGEYPQGRGLLDEVIIAEAPVRLADLSDDPRSVGFPPGHPTMRPFLGVPILRAGRRYGNLYLTDNAGAAPFDDPAAAPVTAVAPFAAGAPDTAPPLTTDTHPA